MAIGVTSMLLRFGVSNHYSIRGYQEISLVASSAIKDRAADLLSVPNRSEKVVPAAVIYGANGSGKTNLLDALGFLRKAVILSHKSGDADSPIPVSPFRLDDVSESEPTTLDCDFILNDVRFSFGVSLSKKRVHEEYLYAYPKGRAQKWYHRHNDEIEFGRSLNGKNQTTFSITRSNSLFLSTASASNHEQLSHVFSYFKDRIIDYDEVPRFGQGCYKDLGEDKSKKARVLRLLQCADISVVGISSEPKEDRIIDNELEKDFDELLEKHLGGRSSEVKEQIKAMERVQDIHLLHKGAKGRSYPLSIGLESRGTQTFLNLLAPVLSALNEGQLLIVDELDTSLHSLLSQQLLSLFNNKTSNRNNAQLLFTTHDTNLLSAKCIRRDQVWFTEKSNDGETKVFPLTEFETRNSDDLEKGYLQGIFGAIPIVGHLESSVSG